MLRSTHLAVAYLGLGSNLGDSVAILAEAVRGLAALEGTRVLDRSGLYRTAAMGLENQPDFLNQVVAVETVLLPHALLEAAQALEQEAGRVRTVRWGPRILDVDILWYDGLVVRDERLELPHPRLGERRFVLEPLAELAPELLLPSGRTVSESLLLVAGQRVERIGNPFPQPGRRGPERDSRMDVDES